MSEVAKRRASWITYATWTSLLLFAGSPGAARLPETPGLLASAVLIAWGVCHALALASAVIALGAFAGGRWRQVTVASGTFLVFFVWVDALLVGMMGQHFGWGALRHLGQAQALTTLGIGSSELLLAGGVVAGVAVAGVWASKAQLTRRSAVRVLVLALAADALCSVFGMVTRFEGIGQLTGLHETMPLAWSPRDDRLMMKLTGHPPRELESTFLFPEGGFELMRRSLAPGPTPALERKTDVLLVVVESLRADALGDMPELQAFAKDALVAEHHYSAGNCTLVGAFSLYTGLSPMFMTAADTWRSRVGLDAFVRAGYQVQVAASASLNMQLPDRLFEQPDGIVVGDVASDLMQRDAQNLDRAIAWLQRPERGGGLFVLFLDATHWPYAGDTKAQGPRLDDSWLLRKEAPLLHARYRAEVRKESARMQRLLTAADARRDDLVVVVTGDHGEAFGEHGVLMHGSRLDEEQLLVPLVMRLPGVAPRTLPGPSVHQDVLPTIFGYLGAKDLAAPGAGSDLLSSTARREPPVVGCCGLGEPVGYAFLHGDDKVLFTLKPDGVTWRGELGPGDVTLPKEQPDGPTKAALDEVQRSFFSGLE